MIYYWKWTCITALLYRGKLCKNFMLTLILQPLRLRVLFHHWAEHKNSVNLFVKPLDFKQSIACVQASLKTLRSTSCLNPLCLQGEGRSSVNFLNHSSKPILSSKTKINSRVPSPNPARDLCVPLGSTSIRRVVCEG